ncbi:subtilase family protein [Nonomuraea polychroma]|uniref:Subtilase family protein n=1 Tax=Nonomuraea polychroma TaxID=46176 RepID=A0A438M048_9ACTN|nr:S8/S53 family peptidase [Nonomuraea polychroma]RVX38987.1 subtilase family protein [Nonomuraea polychroma]
MAPRRFLEQFEQIKRSQDFPVAYTADGGEGSFIYQKGCFVTASHEADVVEDLIATDHPELVPTVRRRVVRQGTGVTVIEIGDPGRGNDTGDPDVELALSTINHGRAVPMATRMHIVGIADVNSCPNDEPEPVEPYGVEQLNPRLADRITTSQEVRVAVVDTGLVSDYSSHAWMSEDVHGLGRPVEVGADGELLQYVGHGTHIASIIKAVAPNAVVWVDNVLAGGKAGTATEEVLAERLMWILENEKPHIISLSAGTNTQGASELKSMKLFMDALKDSSTMLVAAAGNNASTLPFYPAAYAKLPAYRDAVLSVGALRSDNTDMACFSNRGDWVRVYAPGERLTAAFTTAPYRYQHSTSDRCLHGTEDYPCTCQAPRHTGALSADPTSANATGFTGLARWSGTSFSTPCVAGMLVNQMLATKEEDPREAAKALLDCYTVQVPTTDGQLPSLLPPTWTSFSYQEA